MSFSGKLAGVVDEVLARRGLTRRVRASVPMFLTALAAVANSDLLATVPLELARSFAPSFGLELHAPPLPIDAFPISIVRHGSTRSDTGVSWLSHRIQEIAEDLKAVDGRGDEPAPGAPVNEMLDRARSPRADSV